MTDLQPIHMEDVQIVFRNFEGKPDNFNPRGGKRTFAVILPLDVAEAMFKDGWNVKFPGPRDDGETRDPHISVEASFAVKPPKIFVVTSRGKTQWFEPEISMLDWAEIVKVDLSLNPYRWEVGDKSGIKAYLKEIYVWIEESPLDAKYADIPTLGTHTPLDPDAHKQVRPAWQD